MHPGPRGERPQFKARLNMPSSRRTFMKRVVGGLVIAVPAYKVLAGAGIAEAATPKACSGACYPTIVGVYCAGSGGALGNSTSCKGPDVAACMELYSDGHVEKSGYCYTP